MEEEQRAFSPPPSGSGRALGSPHRKCILDAFRAQKTRLMAANVVHCGKEMRVEPQRNLQADEKTWLLILAYATGQRQRMLEVDKVEITVQSQCNAESLRLAVELCLGVLRVYRVRQKQSEFAAQATKQHNTLCFLQHEICRKTRQ